MIFIVISDDEVVVVVVNWKMLIGYVLLLNYCNYWWVVGYVEEMDVIEKVIEVKEFDKIFLLMSDKWLLDNMFYGFVFKVCEGVEVWFDVGISIFILVFLFVNGG